MLYLIRHLPTQFNKKGVLQGSLDIPLSTVSNEDIQLVESNIQELAKIKFEKVYCSELMRTQETAYLHGFNSFIIDEKINELNFGKYEGKSKTLMQGVDLDLWKNDPSKLILGERMSSFFIRIDLFVSNLSNCNVLCFCHGAVMRYLKAKYQLKDVNLMNKIKVKNGELLIIDI